MSEKMNAGFQHEGLYSTHMLLIMLEQSLGFYDEDMHMDDQRIHPSIWNDRCVNALSAATNALADLYQAIGEWEEPASAMQDDSPRMMAIGQNGNNGEHYE